MSWVKFAADHKKSQQIVICVNNQWREKYLQYRVRSVNSIIITHRDNIFDKTQWVINHEMASI